VDGADNNQAFFSEARGRTRAAYSWSQSAIKEFQVGLSNFEAEHGRAAGGMVNAVTKSGTNDLHGEAFYFIRDAKTSARDPFVNQTTLQNAIGATKLPERRQQFGFAMGGPVVRDRVFWFLNWDQQVRNFPYIVSTSSATFLPSDCNTLTNANAQLQTNLRATCAWLQSEATVVPRKGLNEVGLARMDVQLTGNHNLSAYYNFHQWRGRNGIRTAQIQFNAGSDNGFDGVRTDSLYFRLNSVLSNNIVNEARFQFGRDNELQVPNTQGPGTSLTGGFSFDQPNFLPRPAFPFEKRFQMVDNVSVLSGRHTFKFGGDINHVRDTQINLFQGGGIYSYSNLTNLASDCPMGARPTCVPLAGNPRYGSYTQAFDARVVAGTNPVEQSGAIEFATTDWNFYGQDTWKVRNDFTLNYGIRYEYQKLPQPEIGHPNFPLTQSFPQDKNNWGPRIGLAWDMDGKHTTVIRAGYGLLFGRTSNSYLSTASLENGVIVTTLRFFPTTSGRPLYPDCFNPAVNATCSLNVPAGAVGDVFQLSDRFERPMVHQAQFSVEHQFPGDMTFSLTYAYSGGRRLPVFVDKNLPAAGSQAWINLAAPLVVNGVTLVDAGTFGPFPFYCIGNADAPVGNCSNTITGTGRPIQGFGRVMTAESVANSMYNGMIVRLNKRMRNGLLFDSHFTWSHSIDNGQNSTTFIGRSTTFYDPFNPGFDRSDSDFDLRRRFVTAFVWIPDQMFHMSEGAMKAILGDWRFGGSVTLQDGRPVNSTLSGFLSTSSSGPRPIDSGSSNGIGGSFRAPFLARNTFIGPGFAIMDLRVARRFRVTEGTSIEAIVEAFNLFNRTNVVSVDGTAFSTGTNVKNVTTCGSETITLGERCINVNPGASFLAPRAATGTLNGMRDFQFAFKFHW